MVLAVAVYAALVFWADARALAASVASFPWRWFAPMLALAMGNYAIRFLRWQMYLRVLDAPLPARASALVFGAGLAMSVTPGKVGELLKAALLKERHGLSVALTAPAVVAERLTDFIALYVLLLAGIFSFRDRRLDVALGVGLVLLAVGFAAVLSRRFALSLIALAERLPGGTRLGPKLREAHQSAARLLRPGPLAAAVALGVVAWAAECGAYWLALRGVGATAPSPVAAAFLYAAATIAGAVSMLPGGLGVTEGSLTLLSQRLFGLGVPAAGASTLVVRLATLWFAVVVGFVALAVWRATTPRPAAASVPAPAPAPPPAAPAGPAR
jgi:uncharacterized membrane protein YbhN (UPF0104 family)